MRRLTIALLASAAFIAEPASAADIPMPVKARPLPQAAPYNWTGFYVGGHFGGGISRNTMESGGFALGDFYSTTDRLSRQAPMLRFPPRACFRTA